MPRAPSDLRKRLSRASEDFLIERRSGRMSVLPVRRMDAPGWLTCGDSGAGWRNDHGNEHSTSRGGDVVLPGGPQLAGRAALTAHSLTNSPRFRLRLLLHLREPRGPLERLERAGIVLQS